MNTTLCLFLVCAALSGPGPASVTPTGDAWIGEDKWKHFFVSMAATTMTAAGARALGADRDTALYLGVGTGAALGVGKEIRDLYHPTGNPSWRDLVWDAAGVGVGAVIITRTR